MDQTREHSERQPKPSSGISGDLQRLKSDASSTADEVRDFLSTLKGRSPQEVLGAVSESGLVQATCQAAIGCTLLLAVLTVVPWTLQPEEQTAKAAETQTADTETAADNAETPGAASSTETASALPRSESDAPTGNDAERAAAAMKIDETVVTDPSTNPLDGNLDKLLDGLD